MVFSSSVFLFLFLPSLLILYYFPFFRNRTWRNTVLMLFSIGFYAWGEPVFVFVMLFSIFVNWIIGIQIGKNAKAKKTWLCIAIIYDILLIGIFKYLTFVSKNIAFLSGNDNHIIEIALPVGISFFTFQLMSYVFDVYYGNAIVQTNPLSVTLYISLFPQLIAGPIVRYSEIDAEICDRKESFQEIVAGSERFIYGLGKKVLLANYLAFLADKIFSANNHSVASAWLGAISYTLQIYFDFSGYSDMAIGLGKMFGFHFSENFNYPYISANVTEFWRRWHISLSTWFRDYVYIPLGGNRTTKWRWAANLFVVWLLTGIWHGANWTFILWGLLYFVVLIAEKALIHSNQRSVLSHIYTMVIVMLMWVIFRSDTISYALIYLGHLFGINSDGIIDESFLLTIRDGFPIISVSIILSTPIFPKLHQIVSSSNENMDDILRSIICVIIFSLSIIQIVGSTYNPFIYFNF